MVAFWKSQRVRRARANEVRRRLALEKETLFSTVPANVALDRFPRVKITFVRMASRNSAVDRLGYLFGEEP